MPKNNISSWLSCLTTDLYCEMSKWCHCCSSSTPQEWVQFSQYNIVCAEEAMQASQQMREDMSLTRAQVQ